jgi:hypothetical protein
MPNLMLKRLQEGRLRAGISRHAGRIGLQRCFIEIVRMRVVGSVVREGLLMLSAIIFPHNLINGLPGYSQLQTFVESI